MSVYTRNKMMIKHESKFAILFRHWLMANPMHSAVFELKDTRGKNYLSFSEIKDTQLIYAGAIAKSVKGVLIRVLGTGGEPDYIYLHKTAAYFVINFPKFFCIIREDKIFNEVMAKRDASLTAERARELADYII